MILQTFQSLSFCELFTSHHQSEAKHPVPNGTEMDATVAQMFEIVLLLNDSIKLVTPMLFFQTFLISDGYSSKPIRNIKKMRPMWAATLNVSTDLRTTLGGVVSATDRLIGDNKH